MATKVKNGKHSLKGKVVNTFVVIAIISTFFSLLFLKLYPNYFFAAREVTATPKELKDLTQDELKKYDGSDPTLPIYMGYEGNIYDVTAGKNFYEKGATYNYLVGKDSTKELNEVGVGEIIVRKYPVVGKLKD